MIQITLHRQLRLFDGVNGFVNPGSKAVLVGHSGRRSSSRMTPEKFPTSVNGLTHALDDWGKYAPSGEPSVQEAHMRTVLNIALVIAGVLISVMAPSGKPVAITQTQPEAQNVAVIYGLHVAVPKDMKTFPAELVPLP
jgi:hypothetical protein